MSDVVPPTSKTTASFKPAKYEAPRILLVGPQAMVKIETVWHTLTTLTYHHFDISTLGRDEFFLF